MILKGGGTVAFPTNFPPPAFSTRNVLVTVLLALTDPKSIVIGVTITTGLVIREEAPNNQKQLKFKVSAINNGFMVCGLF